MRVGMGRIGMRRVSNKDLSYCWSL